MNEQTLIVAHLDGLHPYIDGWLHEKQGRTGSQRTYQTYADLLAAFRATLQAGGYDLDSPLHLVALVAQGWAAEVHNPRGKPVSNATYNLRLSAMSSFYRYLMRHMPTWEGGNPIERVARRPVHPYAKARALPGSEARASLRQLDRSTPAGARDYALFLVALTTGRRAAELAALTWGDVEQQGNRVLLIFQRTKGGKVLRDVLTIQAGQALLSWLTLHYGNLEALDPLAPLWVPLAHNSTHASLGYIQIRRRAKRVLGTSKVHATRHTFAREMEKAGARVSEIAARLGHLNPAITGNYLQALSSDENPYADVLAGVFAGEEAAINR